MLPEFREITEIVTVSLKTSDVFYKSISGLLEMFWGWPPGTGKDWEHVLRLPTQEDRLSTGKKCPRFKRHRNNNKKKL